MIAIADIILGIILIVGALDGFRKGAIYQVASLAGYIAAISGSLYLSSYLLTHYPQYFEFIPLPIRKYAIIIPAFILIVLAGILIGWALTKLISITGLSLPNRLLGILVGTARYFLINSLIVYVITRLLEVYFHKIPLMIANSILWNLMDTTGRLIVEIFFT